MRVYSRYYGPMQWAGGERFPAEGIVFDNGSADVSDELGSQMILIFPAQFRQTPFEPHEMKNNVDGTPFDYDSPTGDFGEATGQAATTDGVEVASQPAQPVQQPQPQPQPTPEPASVPEPVVQPTTPEAND